MEKLISEGICSDPGKNKDNYFIPHLNHLEREKKIRLPTSKPLEYLSYIKCNSGEKKGKWT